MTLKIDDNQKLKGGISTLSIYSTQNLLKPLVYFSI